MNLKKCPKCGPTIFEERGPMLKKVKSPEKYKFCYIVQCQKCKTKTDLFNREEDAVKDWNHKSIDGMRENEGMELKPCPFCGGTRIEVYDYDYGITETIGVRCKDCGAHIENMFESDEEAVEAWNRRAGEGDTE